MMFLKIKKIDFNHKSDKMEVLFCTFISKKKVLIHHFKDYKAFFTIEYVDTPAFKTYWKRIIKLTSEI